MFPAPGARDPSLTLAATILLLYHFTELLIHEAAVKPATETPWNETDLVRFETYSNFLRSLQSWLDIFLSIPIGLHRSLPFATYPQLVKVLASLDRITNHEDPVWDRAAVRKKLDLMTTCDRIIALFDRLKVAPALISPEFVEDEAYSRGVSILGKMKQEWQRRDAASHTVRHGGHESGVFSMDNAHDEVISQERNIHIDSWFTDVFNASWS